jgi:hypothetical protein
VATVAELVASVLEDGQMDATEPQVLRWLNTRHRQMCARSRCYRQALEIGNTKEGQVSYSLPAGIVEILQVTVGGYVYGTARHNDFAEGELGYVWLSGVGGVAGREDSAQGVSSLRLFPAPKPGVQPEPGTPIVVYAAMQPPVLAVGEDGAIQIGDDYVDALVAGALATAMLRVESRPDLAANYEQIFTTGCNELLRQTNRKFRGTGPALIRVRGINA